MRYLTLQLLLIISIFTRLSASEELLVPPDRHLSCELVQLSGWLSQLQNGLQETSDIETVWVGGGSARAILDHLYDESPLVMRDLDVFAIANQKVTVDFLNTIGAHLETEEFGFFSRKDLRSRPRVPLDKPVLVRNDYVAGYGLHWLRKNGEILDLSVYHSKSDIDLNGIFDIDTTMIPLTPDFSLIDFAKKAKELSYEQLCKEGYLYDRYDGYIKWREGELRIINWLDIEADPLLKISRVVRTLFKNQRYSFTNEEEKNFRYLLNKARIKNPLQMTRAFLKVLADKQATEELALLKKVGLFDHWLPSFNHLIFEEIDLSEIPEIEYGRGDSVAMGRLYGLINQLPTQNQRLEAIYTTMYQYDPPTLLAWLCKELVGELRFIKDIDTISLDRIKKIVISSVLSSADKQALLLSEINGQWRPRCGIISGVFNPVHRGHIEFFHEAINEMALDELIIIHHEGEPLYETPIAWLARWEMLKLIEEEIEELRVVQKKYLPIEVDAVNGLVASLIKQNSTATWVRVLGSDSFEQYIQAGHTVPELADTILVIQKGEEQLYPLDSETAKKVYFKPHQLSTTTNQQPHQAKNARKLASQGKSATPYVSDRVAEYMATHGLYRETSPLYCLTTNAEKFIKMHAIVPNAEQIAIDLPLSDWHNPKQAVKHKLRSAIALGKFPIIVIEQFIKIDAVSSEYIPLSDQTLQILGGETISQLIENTGNPSASILTLVGHASDIDKTKILEHLDIGELSTDLLIENNMNFKDALKSMDGTRDGLDILLEGLAAKKVGFITGVFNPIHLGHLEMLAAVQDQTDLDRIFIIPTPATNHNETPVDWILRWQMIQLAVAHLDGVECIPLHYKHWLDQGTGVAIDTLMKYHPKAEFHHIMGSDSFERFKDHGYLDTLPDRYSVLFVQRPGHDLIKSNHPRVSEIKLNDAVSIEERASSIIREYLEKGYPISHLVLPEVEDFIEKHQLYQTIQPKAA